MLFSITSTVYSAVYHITSSLHSSSTPTQADEIHSTCLPLSETRSGCPTPPSRGLSRHGNTIGPRDKESVAGLSRGVGCPETPPGQDFFKSGF